MAEQIVTKINGTTIRLWRNHKDAVKAALWLSRKYNTHEPLSVRFGWVVVDETGSRVYDAAGFVPEEASAFILENWFSLHR